MPERTELIKEVKNLLSKGLTQKLIAEKLGVSRSTITRIMPKVKEDSSEKYLQIVRVNQLVLGHYPIIHLSTESFKTMLDEDLPLIYVNNNDIYQIQNNQILQFRIQREWANSLNIIFYDFNRWLNLTFETDINNDQQVYSDWNRVHSHIINFRRSIENQINNNAVNWFGIDLENLCKYFANSNPRMIYEYFCDIYEDEITSEYENLHQVLKQVSHFGSLNPKNNQSHLDCYYDFFKLWKKIGNRDQLQTLIAGHMPQITPDRILNKVFSVPKKYVKPMLDLKNYNLTEIKLIVKGGFENQEDIDFAQQGGFDTIKDVRKARKLFCNTWEEMIAVQTNEWEDGNEMRHAMRQGFFENEKDLFTLTTEKNNHIKWNKQSIIWARNSTKDSLERLTNFSSIKSMEFYDYLFTVEEDMFRTDRLMGEYNKLAVPGAKITSEEKFEDFLSQFPDVVDVTNGGLTKILLNSKGVKKIHPRINFNSYPTIKKSRTKLSKSLKKSLAENNLNEASLDSYSWLTEQVRSHLGISQKEELQIVDSCKELLDLSKRETDKLHKTRMARNWVGHKEAEQKVEPSWTYVEYCLNLSERISSL